MFRSRALRVLYGLFVNHALLLLLLLFFAFSYIKHSSTTLNVNTRIAVVYRYSMFEPPRSLHIRPGLFFVELILTPTRTAPTILVTKLLEVRVEKEHQYIKRVAIQTRGRSVRLIYIKPQNTAVTTVSPASRLTGVVQGD